MRFIIEKTWSDGALRSRMLDEGLPETLTHRNNNGYILYRCSVDLLAAMRRSGLEPVLIHDIPLYETIFERKVNYG